MIYSVKEIPKEFSSINELFQEIIKTNLWYFKIIIQDDGDNIHTNMEK